MVEAMGFAPDAAIGCRDFKIGCIGAGFIMADVHLAAYAEAGFAVVAIASRTETKAAEVARRWGIGRVHASPESAVWEVSAVPAVPVKLSRTPAFDSPSR